MYVDCMYLGGDAEFQINYIECDCGEEYTFEDDEFRMTFGDTWICSSCKVEYRLGNRDSPYKVALERWD